MSKRPLPRLEAYHWGCGDEVCDCSQYRVERITPRWTSRGYPGSVNVDTVWEGRFISDTWELTRSERAELLWEYRKAAHEHGITLTRDPLSLVDWHGWRALDPSDVSFRT